MSSIKQSLVFLIFLTTGCITTVKPKEVAEFASTSVRIVNPDQSSGGSGVILESHRKASYVLTNRHVCELLKKGGFVFKDKEYVVKGYKQSDHHDVCLVMVEGNLGINTVVSSDAPELHSPVTISGHPSLYPHVVSTGYVSETFDIQLVVDRRDCTKDEFEQDPFTCSFFGFPIVAELSAQLVSAVISPGSSGSAVFNADGEIVGLAFASNSEELAYALVVPWYYVTEFLDRESRAMAWTKAPKPEVTSKVKPIANVVPFDVRDSENYSDVSRWKTFLEFIEKKRCGK